MLFRQQYKIRGENGYRWGLLSDACISGYIEGSILIGGEMKLGPNTDGSYNFTVDPKGHMVAQSAEVVGKITTEDITATGGTIGGFTITSSYLAKTKKKYNDTNDGVYIGTDGIGLGKNKFSVTSAGKLTATDATITGKITTEDITATGGKIGGFDITDNYLRSEITRSSTTYQTFMQAADGTGNLNLNGFTNSQKRLVFTVPLCLV